MGNLKINIYKKGTEKVNHGDVLNKVLNAYLLSFVLNLSRKKVAKLVFKK